MISAAFKVTTSPLRDSERGVSILELAILLPLLIVLIGGLIDVGLKINRVKTIAEASQYAARIAASSTKNYLTPRQCGADLIQTCGITTVTPPADKSVVQVAKDAACDYITSAGLSTNDWTISVPRPSRIREDYRDFDLIRVNITRSTRACFICYEQYLPALNASSTSTFLLEGTCI